jgi:hypothetical protein
MKRMLSAMDFYSGVRFSQGYIVRLDIKAALREEITMFQDSLSDWPSDGSQRTFTYRSPVRQVDGSWKLIEKTEVMSKEQVQNLIYQFEQIIATI